MRGVTVQFIVGVPINCLHPRRTWMPSNGQVTPTLMTAPPVSHHRSSRARSNPRPEGGSRCRGIGPARVRKPLVQADRTPDSTFIRSARIDGWVKLAALDQIMQVAAAAAQANATCQLIEEQNVNLTGAWVKHSQLDDLQRVTIPTVLKKWYHYEIVAVGHHIRVFRDGRQMVDVEDPHATVTQGNIWFESWSRYSIADVQVWSLRDFVRVPKPEAAPAPAGGRH